MKSAALIVVSAKNCLLLARKLQPLAMPLPHLHHPHHHHPHPHPHKQLNNYYCTGHGNFGGVVILIRGVVIKIVVGVVYVPEAVLEKLEPMIIYKLEAN